MHLIATLTTLLALFIALGTIGFMIVGHRRAIMHALLGTQGVDDVVLIRFDSAQARTRRVASGYEAPVGLKPAALAA